MISIRAADPHVWMIIEIVQGGVWYDNHLFRDGAKNPRDMEYIAEKRTRLGFEGQVEINGTLFMERFLCGRIDV
jgi:hypothetical protein